MPRYQNIFSQVQLAHAPEMGPALPNGDQRTRSTAFSYWMGKLGQAQIGPIYLGKLGIASLLCAFLSFEIIGLNMFASVNWSPI